MLVRPGAAVVTRRDVGRAVLEAQVELTEFTNESYASHASFIALPDHDLPR